MLDGSKKAVGKPELHARNTREINAARVSQVLRLAHHNGGWTTSKIIALAMFHADGENRLTYAQRLLRSTAESEYLLARPLPIRSQAAVFVLTTKGAERVKAELGQAGWLPNIRAGTAWGEHTRDGGWQPPARWVHDERAARFIFSATHELNPNGNADWSCLTESQVRRMNPLEIQNFGKCSDGLLIRFGSGKPKAIWVEVEESRKTGANRRRLLAHLAIIAAGNGPLLRIGLGPFDFARVGKQAFLVFASSDHANNFERAARQWIQRYPGSRLLWQVVIDDGDGLMFQRGKIVDMGIPRNAADRPPAAQ